MERSKQLAIEHWHKINKVDLPEKYTEQKTEAESTKQRPPSLSNQRLASSSNQQQQQDNLEKAGNKRSAPDPPDANMKSPTKKQNTSFSAATTTTNRTEAVRIIENLVLHKTTNDESVPATASVPVLNKIPKLPPSKEVEPLLPREKGDSQKFLKMNLCEKGFKKMVELRTMGRGHMIRN